MEKLSKITVRFTAEDWKALDNKRHAMGLKWQPIGEALWLGWLRSGSTNVSDQPDIPGRNLPQSGIRIGSTSRPEDLLWHKMLDEILQSGVRTYTDAIIANLKGWSRASKLEAPPNENTRNPEASPPNQPSTAADLLGSVERAKESREGIDDPEETDTPGVA